MPTRKSRSVGGADGGASGAKGRALRGEIASRSAVDWLGRPTNGDYRALRNSGWRTDGNLVDRQMADGYLGKRERKDGNGKTGSWVDADGLTGLTGRLTGGLVDGETDGQTYGQTRGRMDERTNG